MITSSRNLYELLQCAAAEPGDKGILVYSPGNIQSQASRLTYHDLFRQAKTNSILVHRLVGITPQSNVILHFDTHLENIIWFWSVLVAGYVPVISAPFANDVEQRKRHVAHLENLLNRPTWITKQDLLPEFLDARSFRIFTVEQVQSIEPGAKFVPNGEAPWPNGASSPFHQGLLLSDGTHVPPIPSSNQSLILGQEQEQGRLKQRTDLAALMLTSGSSGNSKAVCLEHGQILEAIAGKSSHHGTRVDDTFLNWIGMDHVASLTEIHLHAMILGADQVHVQAADLLCEPQVFVELLSRHKVAYTFAPNFFLAALRRALQTSVKAPSHWNLDCLRVMISGGEANVVQTCAELTKLLQTFGTSGNVISPGFGMTETCAGCIYGKNCPDYDLANKTEFASLGTCIPGIAMRIRLDDGKIADHNEIGNLEVSGPVVFREYYSNPSATSEAFHGEWFATGDRARIDSSKQLHLAGRAKETVIINGVNYLPNEIESTLEESSIAGMVPGHTVVFSFRSDTSQTEDLGVVYLPTYTAHDILTRVDTTEAMAQVVQLHTGTRPRTIIPLDQTCLQKSSLGKLSRVKIQTAFLQGKYDIYQRLNDDALTKYHAAHHEPPSNETESALLEVLREFFDGSNIDVITNIMDLGVNSIEIIKIKTRIQRRLGLNVEIPIVLIMTNPTIRAMTLALRRLQEPQQYDPVVMLQSRGSRTPLWLFHPGVGEILVFLQLAKYVTDRPVYALRARGFDNEEPFFESIAETVQTYYDAIKKRQPQGPYALAGYSFGSMLAFETAKLLEGNSDNVKFLASLNLPPHIKYRMRQLDWTEVLLNLAYFLDLIKDTYAQAVSPAMHMLARDQILTHVVQIAPQHRLEELAMSREKLEKWADLAHSMQNMARDYEPSGSVTCMDVFYAIPLSAVAKSKSEWLDTHLSKWSDFCASTPQFYDVDGAHYTMISPEHVMSFQKRLKGALLRRGL
ncbi:MAG: hypothetical protein Q9175_005392 [Cornicularia normoerica]